MISSDRSDSWRRAFQVELRAEAIGLAFRGWPVLPGTYPAGSVWAGRDGYAASGPVPVHADWQARVGTAAEVVATWWTGQPHSLLLATGAGFDAIEVDVDLGREAARVLRSVGVPVPIIGTPDSRWLFLTTSGGALGTDLAAAGAVLHGAGEWITLPPSPAAHGVVHWRVKPEVCGWRIPDSRTVQDALLTALGLPTFDSLVTELVAAD
ncbi:bifunctional DNA primase/polymerase [Actinokineospora bangkokensis]|uniref:DNA primase n=1 Tax=Actinokineospora bangkokensis TaxID=1193682 RepID=A0A1Q9LCJ2_9PSEU|nr:bifunctional DNA primase/polymerase [Actinokineospora bangkokensis]OLR89726.1 DNA primase [Actinokineospora bangkokensis]